MPMRCALNRWRLSRAADDRSAPSSRTVRHVESCSACAAFQTSLATLGRSLVAGRTLAPRPTPVASPMRPFAAVALIASAAALAMVLWLTVARAPTLAEVGPVDIEALAPTPILIAKDDPPLDVDALAGDASGGIRYVLRVSGLGN